MAANLSWYALTVPPQKEWVAEIILRRVGVPCFVPVEFKTPRKRRRFARRTELPQVKRYPMFNRYVFAGFSGIIPLFDLRELRIIQGVVGFDGRPFAIPQLAIDRLMQLSGTSVPWRSAPNPHKSFRVGDKAHVTDGMFTDHVIRIVGLSGEFAQFMGQMFGKHQKLKVPLAFLEAA